VDNPIRFEPGDHVAVELPPNVLGLGSLPRRVVGEVTQVGDDGVITFTVPQEGAAPMEVHCVSTEAIRVRVSPDVQAAYDRGVAAGRTAAAEAMLALADRMERRADGGDNPADCWAMAEFAEELRALASEAGRG
jgi:hypothetical protein